MTFFCPLSINVHVEFFHGTTSIWNLSFGPKSMMLYHGYSYLAQHKLSLILFGVRAVFYIGILVYTPVLEPNRAE